MLDLKQISSVSGVEIGECIYLPYASNLLADGDKRFVRSGSLLTNETTVYPEAYQKFSAFKKNVTSWIYPTVDVTTPVMLSINFVNGLFVCCYASFTNGTEYVMVTSPDGKIWTKRTNPFGPGSNIIDITYGGSTESNKQYVVVGSSSQLATSNSIDGPWTLRSHGIIFGTNAVKYSERLGQFIAVGYNGYISRCAVGSTIWTAQQIVASSMNFNDIACFGNWWFVVGAYTDGSSSTACGYISTDGFTWSLVTTQINNVTTIDVDATFGYVVIANGTSIASAPVLSPTSWTQRTSPLTSGGAKVIVTDDLSIITNLNGQMASSTNGITWTLMPTLDISNYQDIAYGNGAVVVIGSGQGGLALAIADKVVGVSAAIIDSESTLYMRIK